jgi:hypothetical protein
MCIACFPMHLSHGKDPAPDGDFLEYLGQMVEEDGEYLDLMDLAEVEDLPATPDRNARPQPLSDEKSQAGVSR